MALTYATRVTERIYQLDTMALGQPQTVGAYVIKGPKPALVDCGYASSYESVKLGLAELGVMPSDVAYVIPTHVHLDHAGAAGHLVRDMHNARVLAHEKAVPHLVDPTRLLESATRVFGREVMELYGKPIPIPSDRITALGSETSLDLGGGLTANITHAPGHAPHQVAVSIDEEKVILTADSVGIVYPGMNVMIPTTPPPSFEPEALIGTASRLEAMDAKLLLVPHFGVRDDPREVFEQTKGGVAAWVERAREMRKAKMTVDQMTEALQREVLRASGAADLPVYAKVSVRTSVLGISHFLDKNP